MIFQGYLLQSKIYTAKPQTQYPKVSGKPVSACQLHIGLSAE
jgi:hypothetical protein